MRQRLAARGEHRPAPKAKRRAGLTLPLLLGGLALLCLLGLGGCGGASRPKEPEKPPAGINAPPRQGKAGLAELLAAPETLPDPETPPGRDSRFSRTPRLPRSQGPHRARGYQKAGALVFAPGQTTIDRALQLLAGRYGSFAQELGLFDINEDGTPELMVITYGTWMRGFYLYDLSARLPLFLGWHWGPAGPAWARQTENGTAWRLDGNYSHGAERLEVSELFVPAGGSLWNGLQVWACLVDSSTYDRSGLPTAPACWCYRVDQSLFEHGRTIFSARREEELIFPPDELLEERAALDEEGRPAAEQLKENEYPLTEMEERMEASLYRRLMNDAWAGVSAPWTTESEDVYESGNWNNWLGLDLRTRLCRLYAAWAEAHGAA